MLDYKQIKYCPVCGLEITKENIIVDKDKVIIRCDDSHCNTIIFKKERVYIADNSFQYDYYKLVFDILYNTKGKFVFPYTLDGSEIHIKTTKNRFRKFIRSVLQENNKYYFYNIFVCDNLYSISTDEIDLLTGLNEVCVKYLFEKNKKKKARKYVRLHKN